MIGFIKNTYSIWLAIAWCISTAVASLFYGISWIFRWMAKDIQKEAEGL